METIKRMNHIFGSINIGSSYEAEQIYKTNKNYKIITVTNDKPNFEPLYWYPISEREDPDNYALLKQAIDKTMELRLTCDNSILVQCTQGVSRSPGVLIGCLIKTKVKYDEAYKWIQDRVPYPIMVNPYLTKLLRILELEQEIIQAYRKMSFQEYLVQGIENKRKKLMNECKINYEKLKIPSPYNTESEIEELQKTLDMLSLMSINLPLEEIRNLLIRHQKCIIAERLNM